MHEVAGGQGLEQPLCPQEKMLSSLLGHCELFAHLGLPALTYSPEMSGDGWTMNE